MSGQLISKQGMTHIDRSAYSGADTVAVKRGIAGGL